MKKQKTDNGSRLAVEPIDEYYRRRDQPSSFLGPRTIEYPIAMNRTIPERMKHVEERLTRLETFSAVIQRMDALETRNLELAAQLKAALKRADEVEQNYKDLLEIATSADALHST